MVPDVSRPSVLVVQHQANAPVGLLGDWLVEAGAELDVRRPYADEPLPADLSGHHAFVVLGGGMDAWSDDRHPWLTDVRVLLQEAAESRIPTLGICLGHQLAALALGGAVSRNPAGPTLAVLPIEWEPEASGDPLLGRATGAPWGLHWNSDVLTDLPPGAGVLARSPDGSVEAVRLAPTVWGVQLHPEAGPGILRTWVDEEGAPFAEAGADLEAFVAECEARESELAAGWRPVGAALVELAVERAR